MSKSSGAFSYLEAESIKAPVGDGELYRFDQRTVKELYEKLTELLAQKPEMKDYKICHVEYGGIEKTNQMEVNPEKKILLF
jgi:hypothetical protein